MAHYNASVDTSRPPDEMFAYLSDFSSTQEWDPGVIEAERLGDAPVHEGTESGSWPASSAERSHSPTASSSTTHQVPSHFAAKARPSSQWTESPSSLPRGAHESPTTQISS
jgi:hypothetical protein